MALASLQRTAGNAAVANLLARRSTVVQRAPKIKDPPELSAPELTRSPRCRQAYRDRARPLKMGEKSEGVIALQDALIQIGFGHGFEKTATRGQSDGVYGGETYKAVRAFQKSTEDVRPIGGDVAGHKTLLALDRALGGAGAKPVGPDPQASTIVLPTKMQGAERPGSLEKDGKVVAKPQSTVATTATTTKNSDDDDDGKVLNGKLSISLGGTGSWNTAGEAPKGNNSQEHLVCDHGIIEMAGHINVPWKINQPHKPGLEPPKLKLFPEFAVTVDFSSVGCNKPPTLGVQAAAFKYQISRFVEFSLNSAFQLQGSPTGWIHQSSAEFELHFGEKGFWKNFAVVLGLNGGVLLIPRQAGVSTPFITGQGGIAAVAEYTF